VYYLILKTLEPFWGIADSTRPGDRFAAVYLATERIESELERLVTRMRLTWRVGPVNRFLRTQVGLLQDMLQYARPEALRGFGPLDATASAYLAAWHLSAGALLDALAQAVDESDAMSNLREPLPAPETPAAAAGPLNAYQQVALRSFLNAFARELLLVKAYGMIALPPIPSVFFSLYGEWQVARILSTQHTAEAFLQALGAAFGMAIPWHEAAADVVVRLARQAEESISLVSQEAGLSGDAYRREISGLHLMARRLHAIALNLEL